MGISRHSIVFQAIVPEVTVTTSGSATVRGIAECLEDMVSDARFRPGMTVLMDHRGLDFRCWTTDNLKDVALNAVRLGERLGNVRVAHLTTPGMAFGLTRQAQAHADRAASTSMVFHDRDEAIAWLRHHI